MVLKLIARIKKFFEDRKFKKRMEALRKKDPYIYK